MQRTAGSTARTTAYSRLGRCPVWPVRVLGKEAPRIADIQTFCESRREVVKSGWTLGGHPPISVILFNKGYFNLLLTEFSIYLEL